MLKKEIDDLNHLRWSFADRAKDAIILQNHDDFMAYTRFYAILKQLVEDLRGFESAKQSVEHK